MDGMVGGLNEEGWYAPSGGTGPVASMDGHANGWAALGDQIAVGSHDGNGWKEWPIGACPQGDYSPDFDDTPYPDGRTYVGANDLLSVVEGWDHTHMDTRRNFGGDGGLDV
jgi:hypothetical protein